MIMKRNLQRRIIWTFRFFYSKLFIASDDTTAVNSEVLRKLKEAVVA